MKEIPQQLKVQIAASLQRISLIAAQASNTPLLLALKRYCTSFCYAGKKTMKLPKQADLAGVISTGLPEPDSDLFARLPVTVPSLRCVLARSLDNPVFFA